MAGGRTRRDSHLRPHGQARRGGDVDYASSCAKGRINRLLPVDVAGHGNSVARPSRISGLSCLDRTECVRLVNQMDTYYVVDRGLPPGVYPNKFIFEGHPMADKELADPSFSS